MRTSIALAFLICSFAQAQTAPLSFDAASIKPANQPTPNGRGMVMIAGPSGGPGTKDPGRIHYPYMSLKNILVNAYDVKNFQITGPAWLDSERFDIEATMPPETTKEQFRAMLQNLLAERFKLTVHRETKELPVYTLVVAKNGPKLTESPAEPPKTAEAPSDASDRPPPLPMGARGPLKMGADGFPVMPPPNGGRGGMSTFMMPNRARINAQKQTMQDLANRLTSVLNRPVTDATGLSAKFDFTLTYSPEGLNSGMGPLAGMVPAMLGPPPPGGGGRGPADAPEMESAPNLFSAIQSQLGLKLEPKKAPVELIVIDHMEKAPTEN